MELKKSVMAREGFTGKMRKMVKTLCGGKRKGILSNLLPHNDGNP